MTDYPAHIIAQAREIAERLYERVPDTGPLSDLHHDIIELHEALTPTPSEDHHEARGLMPEHRGSHLSAGGVHSVARMGGNDEQDPQAEEMPRLRPLHHLGAETMNATTQPEPTEDHLRRACEELGLVYDNAARMFKSVRTVARLLAERDAMQAGVEPVAYLYTHWGHPANRSPASLAFPHERTERLGEGWTETPLYAGKSTGPTPDPDLVMEREAENVADGIYSRGALPYEWALAKAGAFRALKLKGQE